MEARPRFSSSTLIQLSQNGDPHAFSRLVETLRSRLEGLVRALVRSRGIDAEEVLQDAFVHAFRSIGSLRVPTSDGFVAWFAGIVRNRISTAWREGTPRERPRLAAGLPRSMQPGIAPDALDGLRFASDGRSGLKEQAGYVREGLPVLTADRRVAYLLHDGFTSTLDTLGLVLDRDNHGGMRQSLRKARCRLAPE